jgi:hypothetical protein
MELVSLIDEGCVLRSLLLFAGFQAEPLQWLQVPDSGDFAA